MKPSRPTRSCRNGRHPGGGSSEWGCADVGKVPSKPDCPDAIEQGWEQHLMRRQEQVNRVKGEEEVGLRPASKRNLIFASPLTTFLCSDGPR